MFKRNGGIVSENKDYDRIRWGIEKLNFNWAWKGCKRKRSCLPRERTDWHWKLKLQADLQSAGKGTESCHLRARCFEKWEISMGGRKIRILESNCHLRLRSRGKRWRNWKSKKSK